MVKSLYFVAIMLTAIALGAGLAHFFELPNKIGLGADDYLTVQRNYDNWWIVGLVVPLALLSVIALTVALRGSGLPFTLALVALALLVCELGVFWGFTAPVNRATENWTMLPENWQALRAQWEYSHAVRAIIYLLALGTLVMSLLEWRINPRATLNA
jgi:amino acid permease